MPSKWLQDPKSQRYYYFDDNGRAHWQDEVQTQDSGSGRDSRKLQGAGNSQTSAATPVQQNKTPASSSSGSYSYYSTAATPTFEPQQSSALSANVVQQAQPRAVTSVGRGVQRSSIPVAQPREASTDTQQRGQYVPQPIVPRTWQESGIDYLDIMDNRNKVHTIIQTGPANYITPSLLSREGIPSHMNLLGTDGEAERLFDSFRKRSQPRKFFTVGKVFLVLWSEPAGDQATLVSVFEKGTSLGRFGEAVFSKVRRFVVVKEANTFCGAIPITTYGGRGLAKAGTTKFEHGIIHTGKESPRPTPDEAPSRSEKPMQPDPIRVDTDSPNDKLDAMSRVDYGKVYTIEHNVKVKSLGEVNPGSMNSFLHQFRNVWAASGSSRAAGTSQASLTSSLTSDQPQAAVSASHDSARSARKQSTSSMKSGKARGSPVLAASNEEPRRGPPSSIEPLAQQARALAQQMIVQGWPAEQAAEYALQHFQPAAARQTQLNLQGSSSSQQTPTISQSQFQSQPQLSSTQNPAQPLTPSQNQIQEDCVAILAKNGYSRQQALEYIWSYAYRIIQEHNYSRDQALAALKTHLNRSQSSNQGQTASSERPQRGSQSSNKVLPQQARGLATKSPIAGHSTERANESLRERYQQSVSGWETQRQSQPFDDSQRTRSTLPSQQTHSRSTRLDPAASVLNSQNRSAPDTTQIVAASAGSPTQDCQQSGTTRSASPQIEDVDGGIVDLGVVTLAIEESLSKLDGILEAENHNNGQVSFQDSVPRHAWISARNNVVKICREWKSSSRDPVQAAARMEQRLALGVVHRTTKALNDHLEEVRNVVCRVRKPLEEDTSGIDDQTIDPRNAHQVSEIPLRFECISLLCEDLSTAIQLYEECISLDVSSDMSQTISEVEQQDVLRYLTAHLEADHSGMDSQQVESVCRLSQSTASKTWILCPLCGTNIPTRVASAMPILDSGATQSHRWIDRPTALFSAHSIADSGFFSARSIADSDAGSIQQILKRSNVITSAIDGHSERHSSEANEGHEPISPAPSLLKSLQATPSDPLVLFDRLFDSISAKTSDTRNESFDDQESQTSDESLTQQTCALAKEMVTYGWSAEQAVDFFRKCCQQIAMELLPQETASTLGTENLSQAAQNSTNAAALAQSVKAPDDA